MHDLGDAPGARGASADPVMEMEVITLEYATVGTIARDLKAIGAHNADAGPAARTCRDVRRWQRVIAAYENASPQRRAARDLRGDLRPRMEGRRGSIADGRQVIDFHAAGMR